MTCNLTNSLWPVTHTTLRASSVTDAQRQRQKSVNFHVPLARNSMIRPRISELRNCGVLLHLNNPACTSVLERLRGRFFKGRTFFNLRVRVYNGQIWTKPKTCFCQYHCTLMMNPKWLSFSLSSSSFSSPFFLLLVLLFLPLVFLFFLVSFLPSASAFHGRKKNLIYSARFLFILRCSQVLINLISDLGYYFFRLPWNR